MKTFTFTTAALAVIATAPALSAQRITVDLRGTAAAPTQKFAGATLETGVGFGGALGVRLLEHVYAYGGWDWVRFRADQSFAGADLDFEETGYSFGLRFEHVLPGASFFTYRVEAGGTYKHIELENEDGVRTADSGHGLGFELGTGVLMPLGNTWSFAPTLRYRSLSREFNIGGTTTQGDQRYAALEFGLSRKF